MAARWSRLAGLILLVLVAAVQPIAAQEVTIPSAKLQIPGILHKPGGDGPFPALVFLVGCEGNTHPAPPLAEQHAQWVDRLGGWGYVTLELDSFTPRNRDSCDSARTVSEDMRCLDAYAAKSYLSTLLFVDPDNVGVIGWSHGGSTILTIIDASSGLRLVNKLVSPFKAAVAFYPYSHSLYHPDTPVLVLTGRKDQSCPAYLAESMDRDYKSSNREQEFSLTVYPNATHGFDVEGFKGGFDFAGRHMDYDPQATADAITRTKDFLAKYMR
ncbi:MAG: dienelactone hydrolase family protein [Spirochaetia bacterium]|jgi:dienelactone hydrolase